MIKVNIHKEKNIKKDEVLSIIDLLHEDYGKIDVDIYIIGSAFSLIPLYIKGILDLGIIEFISFFFMVYFKRSYGCENNGIIFIFSRSIEEERDIFKKLVIISIMLHELRHAYQYEYNNIGKLKDYDYDNYIPYGNGYESQYIERDANKFATRMLNKYAKEIYKILDLDFIYIALWCDSIQIKNVGKGYFNENNK